MPSLEFLRGPSAEPVAHRTVVRPRAGDCDVQQKSGFVVVIGWNGVENMYVLQEVLMAAKRGLTDVAWTGYLHSGLARPQIR
jgi:hypothetical protein